MIFLNRTDAALQLYDMLKVQTLTWAFQERKREGGGRGSWWPPVLAVQIGAERDIELDCKLPSPGHPELAMGAISEGRGIVWNEDVRKKNIKRGLEQSPKA